MTIGTPDGAVYKDEMHHALGISHNEPQLLQREVKRYLSNHPDIQPHQLVSHMLSDRKV